MQINNVNISTGYDAPGAVCLAHYDTTCNTIRASNCELVVGNKEGTSYRCQCCTAHRKTLCALLSQHTKKEAVDATAAASHTNYRYLSNDEKKLRLHQLHLKNRQCGRRIKSLKAALEKAIQQRGVAVDSELHNELTETMIQKSQTMSQQLPAGSFARIFWDNQLQAAQQQDSRSMRWDPIMIKWCLYLRHISGRAYEMVRESGVVSLPSQRTLRDYTYHTQASTGFSSAVDQHLITAANLGSCPERDRYIVILMDEMHIREDIVYDPVSG